MLLCCPTCHRSLTWTETDALCAACGTVGRLHGGRVADFVSQATPQAKQIWQWPTEFVLRVGSLLHGLNNGSPPSTQEKAELVKHGLIDDHENLTVQGDSVDYHVAEYQTQGEQNQFISPRFVDTLTPTSKVLDVGGGAGQTLRWLDEYPTQERIGVDIDLVAVTFGTRFLEHDDSNIQLLRASGYELPFADHYFSHIICRVALACMHQRRALREMVRVLRPGGMFYCHIEGPGFDLRRLLRARRPKDILGCLRDYLIGINLALTGWQPTPGTKYTGSIIFGTGRAVTRQLRRLDCDVLQSEVTGRYLGLPFGYKILARRRTDRS